MYCIMIPLFTPVVDTLSTSRQSDTPASEEGLWPTYGYIALGALILIAVAFILLRKQYRKFNE